MRNVYRLGHTRDALAPGVSLASPVNNSHSAWDLLRGAGVIQSRDTLKDALRHGQRPTAELVDSYNIQSTQIRNVLVRYLEERRPGVDYGTFRGLVSELAGVFWADIETHHPGIDTLRIPDDVIDGWKQRLMTYTDKSGQVRERRSRIDVMMRIRGFYLDIQEWAHEDPYWAQWAVPSPITRCDGAGNHKMIKQTTARMHQRVRERLPHLPVLVETAERVRREAVALLDAARATPFNEVFEHDGRRYLRVLPKVNQVRSRLDHGSPHVYIKEVGSTGRRINQSVVEDDAFWSWAVIETLRHTGVRAEELTELTHLALVSYKLPDQPPEKGEVVPLLQIVPSKSNEERLLLVSPELASVLATIIKRLRDVNGGKIPLVARYDSHERVTGPQLPHLFQRRPYWQPQVLSEAAVKRLLDRTLECTGLRDQAGEPLRYTPHDFRRMFATEAVTGGLPVHIAARILGHKTLTTTQAYLAVFQRLDQDLPRLPRPSTRGAPPGGVPGAHSTEVARLPAALRTPQGLARHLRAPLRNPLQARARLHPLPGPPDGPPSEAPSHRDHPEPPRPHPRGSCQRLARRGRGPSGQLRRGDGQAQEPQEHPHRRTSSTGRPWHARLHRRRITVSTG
ncbi:site-specific integrase [Streptomyces longwoodensis]|uniref:site-specific integrase n=1 Tax=Streptomyces longwoodensis TaxID=68231 RepID=UPI003411D2B5